MARYTLPIVLAVLAVAIAFVSADDFPVGPSSDHPSALAPLPNTPLPTDLPGAPDSDDVDDSDAASVGAPFASVTAAPPFVSTDNKNSSASATTATAAASFAAVVGYFIL